MSDTATAPVRALPLDKAAPVLAMHVSRVQRRMGRIALATGVAMAVPALVLWLAIEMPLDWHYDLPRWARALFLLAGLGGAAAIAAHFGIRRWMRRPDDDGVALAIERALPELRSRFIASVQLSRRPSDHALPLVRALVKETTERTRDLEFSSVVPTDSLRRWLAIAAAVCLLGAGLWWWGGSASWPLFQRAWLLKIPKPSNTRIVAFTGNRVVAAGDDLRLEATAEGVIPPAGRLKIKAPNGEVAVFTLDADPAHPGRFLRVLQAMQQSFRYRIELGDGQTEWAEVRVRPRPVIQALAFEQHWPPYTGIPPQRRAPGDLQLLAGSRLEASIQTNVPLREAAIQLLTSEQKLAGRFPMQRAADAKGAPSKWRGVAQIPAKDAAGVTFQLADEEGVESRAMAVYRLQIVPDEAPSLEVLWPQRREELVTPRATLLVVFEAKDDFGIDRIKLHYAINWRSDTPHRTLDLNLGQSAPKALTRRFEWRLAQIDPPLQEGDVIDYWFEVSDRNNVTGPGIAAMPEHYQARVVSEEEKRADLAARLTDTLQGLNVLRLGQEDLARQLGEVIYEMKP